MEMQLERQLGFITAVHRDRYEVQLKEKEVYAKLKTGNYYKDGTAQEFPTVGDNIVLLENPTGDSLIIETLERKTKFSRKDPDIGRGEQIIAANFDYIFIMMSLNYDFNLKRLERYLTVAWQSGGEPIIILTKKDLAMDFAKKLEEVAQVALGAKIHAISSVTGDGMDEVKAYLQPGKTAVFLGSSGVGKSTLTNFLLGEELMLTDGIREEDSKGHHTTTHRQLLLLENGARIIDTPGMRELGMWEMNEGSNHISEEIESIISNCKYSNCSHGEEPGCAVRAALENGSLQRSTWKNYNKMLNEAKIIEARQRLALKQSQPKKKRKSRMKNIRNWEE